MALPNSAYRAHVHARVRAMEADDGRGTADVGSDSATVTSGSSNSTSSSSGTLIERILRGLLRAAATGRAPPDVFRAYEQSTEAADGPAALATTRIHRDTPGGDDDDGGDAVWASESDPAYEAATALTKVSKRAAGRTGEICCGIV